MAAVIRIISRAIFLFGFASEPKSIAPSRRTWQYVHRAPSACA